MSLNIYISLIAIFSLLLGTRVIHHPFMDLFSEQSNCDSKNIDMHWENSVLSESKEFIIHFNDPLLYDYAFKVGAAADSSKKVIVDIMEFKEEIKDADGIYDIYIKDFNNGNYGINCIDTIPGATWIEIDDDYSEDIYLTHGDDAMNISVAHEYFHATERAYIESKYNSSYFYEFSKRSNS